MGGQCDTPALRLRSSMPLPEAYWTRPAEALLRELGSAPDGLAASDAAARLADVGPNRVEPGEGETVLMLAARQFASPLVLILVFGALVSIVAGDWLDAAIILVIVAGGTLLGFTQEYRGSRAVAMLRQRLALSTRVFRDGRAVARPAAELVPGDVVLLSAGNLVPADGVVLEARDFLVNEAALTGESFPAEKAAGTAPLLLTY